ncbi:hypothetical protein CHH28_01225 [Bacterioplanes sanyensis]|uniref:Lipoprotein n=1 Tax=Bacterioplanes sanyensis TaxID=1249553 RepID=A0A222FFW2_9GAMM|nr:hypothetical protein [Bacterioplanes sanyensis]ASP37384.1 hypothetical protein CHH28_01225 [Bacterioplanes sanyensis]
MKKIFPLFFLAVISGCGGDSSGSNNDSDGTTIDNDDQKSEYMDPSDFSAHFNNSRDPETETTEEYEAEEARRLAEVANTKLIKEIDGSYDADTGYATVRIAFGYSINEKFQGPSYLINSSVWGTTNSRSDIVFLNETEAFKFYSSDLIPNCEIRDKYNSEHKETHCDIQFPVERNKYRDYDYHFLFDLKVDTVQGFSSKHHGSLGSSYSKDIPIAELRSISIIDLKTNTVFGTMFPYK